MHNSISHVSAGVLGFALMLVLVWSMGAGPHDDWPARISATAAALMLPIAAAGVWFVALTLGATTTAIKENRLAIDAAVEANRIQLEGQRAWVKVLSIEFGDVALDLLRESGETTEGAVPATVRLANIGQSVAGITEICIRQARTGDLTNSLDQYQETQRSEELSNILPRDNLIHTSLCGGMAGPLFADSRESLVFVCCTQYHTHKLIGLTVQFFTVEMHEGRRVAIFDSGSLRAK